MSPHPTLSALPAVARRPAAEQLDPERLLAALDEAERSIAKKTAPGVLTYPVAIFALACFVPISALTKTVLWWLFAASLVIAIVRLVVCLRFSRGADHWRHPARAIVIYGALAAGMVWIAVPILIMLEDPGSWGELIALAATIAMCSSAIPVMAARLGVLRAYQGLMLLPLILATIVHGGAAAITFGFLLGLYLIYQLRIASTAHHELWTRLMDHIVLEQQTEDLEMARQLAERANRLKSEFLAKVSHEIRTPMNAVIGMAELLLRSSLDQRQLHYADTVHQAAEGLLVLVDDLIDLSRIEADRLPLEIAPLAPSELAIEIVELFSLRATDRGLELEAVLDTEAEVFYSDPARVRQILVNLIGNAVKYSDVGRIELRLEMVEEADNFAWQRFAVSDRGPGIAMADLDQLFEPFTQGTAGLESGGSGLGLAISRRLAERLGGHLDVESRIGEGSTFSLELPMFRSARRAEEALEAESRRGPVVAAPEPGRQLPSSRRVLVVDDNPINREVALDLLIDLGVEAEAVVGGREALESLELDEYGLVLMDCRMPDLDGYETTRRIREIEGGERRLPIVAVTAHAMKGEREVCLAAGMDDYLAKPFRLADLTELIERWLPGIELHKAVLPPRHRALEFAGLAFDTERLEALEALGERSGRDILGHVLGLAKDLYPDHVIQLKKAVASEDRQEIRRIAHSLKGSAGHLGADGIVDAADALGHAAKRRDLPVLEALAEDLATEIAQALSALDTLLDHRPRISD